MNHTAAFCLFGTTLPIHFALLERKRKYIKSTTTSKLQEKRTSIVAVRDKLGPFDIFPTPRLSHCRLPLRKQLFENLENSTLGDSRNSDNFT
jgi:hypothetical protein